MALLVSKTETRFKMEKREIATLICLKKEYIFNKKHTKNISYCIINLEN